MKSKTEIIARVEHLQRKIAESMQIIRDCENELVYLGQDDVWDSGFNTRELLWKNLRRVQDGHGSVIDSLGKYSEDPCFAVAALLEQQLLPKLESGLQMWGCSILARDRFAQFCITGDVAENIAERIRVYG